MPESTLVFPPAKRAIYAKNPLHEVVCQLRFPTILRIASEIPSAFQERIRHKFPEYAEEINALVPTNLPPQMIQLLSGSTMPKRHKFSSSDGSTSILLDGQNITVVTTEYASWEEYSGQAFSAISSFLDEYSPSSIGRVGLRYQNLIPLPEDNSGLRLTDYLRPELIGVLAEQSWENSIFEFAAQLRCRLEHAPDKLFIQYGLLSEADTPDRFNLDFDYYIDEETDPNDAKSIIERLHGYSGPAFRWAIRDALHEALEPRSTNRVFP